ncbi:hypothetical protein [Lacticaseibacillus hegangensis]|uniref:Uncharacterized protein n=1 Tax=Lacticaseibacillus hegangensis TaxID=2486010 RepID=A0ABW4CWM2_9LACO|nr:hypothetical protein [Lacticaseibacillus hegangensis]
MSLTKSRLLYAALMLVTLVVAVALGGNSSRLGMLLWVMWLLLSAGYNKQRLRALDQKLDEIWRLADAQGLTAADLKQYTPQYGTLDLKMTRPGRRQFYPSMKATDKLLAALREQAQTAADDQ